MFKDDGNIANMNMLTAINQIQFIFRNSNEHAMQMNNSGKLPEKPTPKTEDSSSFVALLYISRVDASTLSDKIF